MVRLRYRLVPQSLALLVSLTVLMFIVCEIHCWSPKQI
jgi:hypothetical protein